MIGMIKFDFGYSYRELGVNVTEQILLKFPVSLKLGALATLLVIVVGIPIGIISALKQNTWVDQLAMFIATVGVTIPGFVVATLYVSIVAGTLGWVDATGLDSWESYIGPVLALSFYSLSFVSRLTRSSMLEILRQDYMRTARANGLSKFKVLYKHALKNAFSITVRVIGYAILGLVAFMLGTASFSLFVSGISMVFGSIIKMIFSSLTDVYSYLALFGVVLIGSSLIVFSVALVKWFIDKAKPSLLAIFRNTKEFLNRKGK